jgi:hypothetical protein
MKLVYELTRDDVEVALRAHIVHKLKEQGHDTLASEVMGEQWKAEIAPAGHATMVFGDDKR